MVTGRTINVWAPLAITKDLNQIKRRFHFHNNWSKVYRISLLLHEWLGKDYKISGEEVEQN